MTQTLAPSPAAALAPAPAPQHQVFFTRDPDQAHAYICRTYTPTTMRMLGDQTDLQMRDEQRDLGSFATGDFSHSTGSEHLGDPLGRLVVSRTVAGRWRCDTIGEERRVTPGDVFLVAQPDRPYLSRWREPIRTQVVSLDPSMLLDVAAGPGDLVPRFTSLVPTSAGGRRLLSTVLDHIVDDVVANPAAGQLPIVRHGAARMLASALLEALPNTAVVEPAAADRVDAMRSRVLRTSVAYLHDHAHTEVSVRQLAEMAGVSRQAVYLAFRQHLQVTPHAYLERIRLDRVHRDLTDLEPGTTTVDEIAVLWGFTRLERFRRHYRAAFGVEPEQTLRGGRVPQVVRRPDVRWAWSAADLPAAQPSAL